MPRKPSARAGSGRPSSAARRERPLGGRDRLPEGAADDARARQLCVGGDELGAGRLRLEQLQRLRERLLLTWCAQSREHEVKRGQRPPGGDTRVLPAVEGERLLERGPCLLGAALLLCRLRPALEQRRALGMSGWGKRERLRQALFGAVDVERKRALARQSQVADRVCLQLPRLLGLACGADELERAHIVVGEHVGQVLGPLALPDARARRRRSGGGWRGRRAGSGRRQRPGRAGARSHTRSLPPSSSCGQGGRVPCAPARAARARLQRTHGRPLPQQHLPRTPSPSPPRPGAGSFDPG